MPARKQTTFVRNNWRTVNLPTHHVHGDCSGDYCSQDKMFCVQLELSARKRMQLVFVIENIQNFLWENHFAQESHEGKIIWKSLSFALSLQCSSSVECTKKAQGWRGFQGNLMKTKDAEEKPEKVDCHAWPGTESWAINFQVGHGCNLDCFRR